MNSSVYDELEEITGYSRGVIKNFKSVAEKTSSLRHDDLSFEHHRFVAPLPPEKQKEFLQRAVDENLTTKKPPISGRLDVLHRVEGYLP